MVHQETQSRLALPCQVKLHLVMVMALYPLTLIQNLDDSTGKQRSVKILFVKWRIVTSLYKALGQNQGQKMCFWAFKVEYQENDAWNDNTNYIIFNWYTSPHHCRQQSQETFEIFHLTIHDKMVLTWHILQTYTFEWIQHLWFHQELTHQLKVHYS